MSAGERVSPRTPALKVALAAVAVAVLSAAGPPAPPDPDQRVETLQKRVKALEDYTYWSDQTEREQLRAFRWALAAGLLLLWGFVCALWAQNTDRNPWLWFALGCLFTLVTMIVLLLKNADDRRRAREARPPPGRMP